ncbi:MAG: BtpA/SgcQ family protein [Actinomycetota bacterium]|nr:BtpA/SgcQ family protein [Actinomycetota bacterium]
MSPIPRLVGMVHLIPLPGSPGFNGSMGEVIESSVAEALALASAGFPALLVENFGDVPFHADRSDPETVAAMTLTVRAVGDATGLPLGINVLRNDPLAALAIAAVTGADFIRVNVLTGVMYTDQGPIVGRADEVMRRRAIVTPDVEVWADVMVKHATPPPGLDIGQAAEDAVVRGLADAVIVSGKGTGGAPDLEQARLVRPAVPKDTRVVIGSGARAENLGALLEVADTIIVGSSIKVDGVASGAVDPLRAAVFVEVARDHGLL